MISGRRDRMGLTQKDLSRLIGVSVRAIHNWENGVNIPLLFDGLRLCKALKINTDDLIKR